MSVDAKGGDRAGLIARASALVDAERFEEAIPVLEALAKLDDRAAIHVNLGVCRHRTGAQEAALDHFRDALLRDPDNRLAINNIAVVSSMLGAPEILDGKALSADTWNSVGLNAYFRGQFRYARWALEKALAVNPENYVALNNIADLIERDEAPAWIERAGRLRPEAPEDIASVAYMQAHLHDMLGQHQAAAAAWARGGAAKIRTFATPFSAPAHRGLVTSIIEAFGPDRIPEIETAPPAAPRLIFIVGMPRSGSTLTARMIGGDPAVTDLGEDRTLPTAVIAEQERLGEGGERAPLAALTRESMERIREAYLGHLPPGEVFVDKYPENYLLLGVIRAAFPGARVIHTRRDRYDTLISCYSKNFTSGNAWSYRPEDVAAYHAEYERLMAHWAATLPPEMLMTSDYGALTADPDAALAALCAHCGLDAAAARARGHSAGGKVETASAKQIRGAVQARDPSRYAGYRPFVTF